MASTKERVEAKIHSGKKVVMFSKLYCPYCKKAKAVFEKYLGKELSEDDYDVWEIENEKDCGDIQNVLEGITKGRSVPRVFINGKFIGGGDETAALDRDGKLKPMLTS